MRVTARLSLFVVGSALFCVTPLIAQPAIAHVSQVEGTVTRLHRFVPAVASVGVVLVEGDQIVTAVGRAELRFVDGSVMHLDHHTQVSIAGAARIRLIDGRVSLRTTTRYTAETSSGIVHVLPAGVFELTASAANRDVLVRVIEGEARIESPWGVESVTSTQTAFVSGPTGRPFVSSWIQVQHDSFVQWCNLRYVAVVPSPRFLPFAHPSAFARKTSGELRRDQSRYEHTRFDRKRAGVQVRGDQKMRGDQKIRGDRAGATSGREGGPPPAKPKPVRGATAGKVVRQP